MEPADHYRKIAAELRAKVVNAPSDTAAADLDNLARAYLQLAEQAEQNRRADVWAEFGPPPRIGGDGNGEAA